MIAVVAVLTSCAPAYFDPDEERAGILIEWGTQRDRAGLEEVVGACEESLGFRFVHGAAVKFVDDANRHCAIPSHTPVAGCWVSHFDLIVLEPAPSLAETAICHELLHRQLFDRITDADYHHRRHEWTLLASALARLKQSDSP